MNLLHWRVILNALAALSAAVGAAMLVPAAYSLLTRPDNAWIFWLPGASALAFGAALGPAAVAIQSVAQQQDIVASRRFAGDCTPVGSDCFVRPSCQHQHTGLEIPTAGESIGGRPQLGE